MATNVRLARFVMVAMVLLGGVASGACSGRERASGPTATPSASEGHATSGTTATGTASTGQNAVPAEYAAMYQFLSQGLDAWEQATGKQQAAGVAPVFGAHVLAANANRGPELLLPTTLPTVDATLDRLKQLGVGGVTVTISFPLLNADYPRSADYLDFYAKVAEHVRARGLKLSVEQHVAFSGTAFSSVQFDYRKLPFDQFVALFHDMTAKIVDRVRPDYLTLLSEPDTFGALTGYRDAGTPQGAAAMIGKVIAGINRGTTKLGAGAGSWLASAPQYDTAFAQLGLDYIDLHIYPVTEATVATLGKILDAARAAGKSVVLDEAWLFKVGADDKSDIPFAQPTEAFRRDAFSFWSPLDSRFLQLVAQFAKANGIAYAAPFWSTFFLGVRRVRAGHEGPSLREVGAVGQPAGCRSAARRDVHGGRQGVRDSDQISRSADATEPAPTAAQRFRPAGAQVLGAGVEDLE